MTKRHDVAVIGGGIVGLATARAIMLDHNASVVLLEAERGVGRHQTGHNSGVIHSGLYYKPGSLKAKNCVAGRESMVRFCEVHGIPFETCGKLVVATTASEVARLDELERRGRANGLAGVERLGPDELRRHEPHARGLAALWVPQTGIVDFGRVAAALADQIRERDGEIRTQYRVTEIRRTPSNFVLISHGGEEVHARNLINCGGLQADRIAVMCGLRPTVRIVPFRGDYWVLVTARRGLVRNLIYPVPDPRFPFLGVHFTRTITGEVEMGPTAVLALRRGGYDRWSISGRDAWEVLSYVGFWRLVARYWRTAIRETGRSLSRRALVNSLRRLVPDLNPEDVVAGGAGIRAQAVSPDGSPVDDFRIVAADRMLHVLNAPSPAATASLSIGSRLAHQAAEGFGLSRRASSALQ